MEEQVFYICPACGESMAGENKSPGVDITCCNRTMERLEPNAGSEQDLHLPIVHWDERTLRVTIGGEEHPMEKGHYIEWIYLHTESAAQRKRLRPGGRPQAAFRLERLEPVTVYALCSRHGLWRTRLSSSAGFEESFYYLEKEKKLTL